MSILLSGASLVGMNLHHLIGKDSWRLNMVVDVRVTLSVHDLLTMIAFSEFATLDLWMQFDLLWHDLWIWGRAVTVGGIDLVC